MTSISPPDDTRPVRAWPDLVFVLALALALRLTGLGRFPFWEDELYSQIEGLLLWRSPLDNGIGARPLFFLLQRPFLLWFPFEPMVQRALACAFGLAGVALVWYVASRLFGRGAGLIAGLLAACAPTQLFASQSVRYWSLIFLLMVAFLDRLAAAVVSDRKASYLQACGIFLIGLLTHPTFVIPATAALATCLLDVRSTTPRIRLPTRNAWTYLLLPIVVATGCFYVGLSLFLGSDDLQLTEPVKGGFAPQLILGLVYRVTPVVAVAGFLGAAWSAWDGRVAAQRAWGYAALAALIGGMTGLQLISLMSPTTSLYTMPLEAPLLVSAGALLPLLLRSPQPGALATGTFAMLLAVGVLPSTVSYAGDGGRFDYRPALATIREQGPGLPVLMWPVRISKFYAPDLTVLELPPDASVARLDSLTAAGTPFWAVTSLRRRGLVYDEGGSRAAWLDGHCRRVQATGRPRLDFDQYTVELLRCGSETD